MLFVVPDLTVGGAERHVATLLPALDPDRFEPAVICLGRRGKLFAELVDAGIPARALGRSKRGVLLMMLQLLAHMRRLRPDIVVVRGTNASVLGRIAAVLCRVPRTVVWVHNCGDLGSRPRLPRLADRVLEPVTSAYYGVAYGQVPYLTGELAYPAVKVQVVQNGVDLARFPHAPHRRRGDGPALELGIGPTDPVVVMVAVLRPEKDHATFFEAVRLAVTEVPDARFLVVGRGPLRDELVALAAELGVSEHVVFTGPRSDVPALLELADVFTLTSRTIECFPMALLEAMAVGRPAVCTAVGGIPEMIDDGVTGHLVPARDPVALAKRWVELLTDPARAAEMGTAARARVAEHFTLGRSVRNAELALERTAGRLPAVERATRC